MLSAPGRALSPGTRIDRYRLGERIGGGFGVVYAAVDDEGARVALKTLRADGQDPRQGERLAREARVANDIEHPAVVRVLATGTLEDGRPYLAMPLLEGRTLQQAIHEEGALAPDRAWRLLRPIAEALAEAHARGVVHRDVKPSNVFLEKGEGGEESPRLLDFGLAHALDPRAGEPDEPDELVKLTQSGVLVGTPAYMAPEQWWGMPAAPGMDQYVLGATLFEALTGHPPFRETALRKLMERALHSPAPSILERAASAENAATGEDAATGERGTTAEHAATATSSDRAAVDSLSAPPSAGTGTAASATSTPLPDHEAAAAIDAFVRRLLAKDPAERFPSMEDAIAAGDAAFARVGEVSATRTGEDRAAREGDTGARGASTRAGEAAEGASNGAGGSEPAPGREALAERPPLVEDGRARTGGSRRGMWLWHAGVVAGGLGALAGVGYAGEARRDVVEWMRIGGYAQLAIVAWFVLGAVALPLAARRRPGALPRGALAWGLAPALSGLAGIYLNWQAVEHAIRRVRGLDALRVFCAGTYEANAARFLGFALSAVVCTSLVALPAAAASGARAGPGRAETSPGMLSQAPADRRAQAAALLTLAALVVAASALGAPSGAWVALIAALCVAGGALFQVARPGAELERAAATVLAVGLAFAVGLARVEARQAVLWVEPSTRAARVAEILDARAEMNATLLLGAASILGAGVPAALALARAARAGALARVSRAMWIGAGVIALAAGLDLVMRQRFLDRREELRAELTPQFATFFHLDPPAAGDLDAAAFAPRRSTGLQIGRDAVAVDGRGIAKLAALDSEAGLFHATAALHQALAQAAVERGGDEVDLSVTADEEVPYGKLARLLAAARTGGARRVDLLLRRGPRPVLGTDSPPEASYVVPSDFVAVPAVLADEGFTAPDAERWATVAPRLARELAPDTPIPLRAR